MQTPRFGLFSLVTLGILSSALAAAFGSAQSSNPPASTSVSPLNEQGNRLPRRFAGGVDLPNGWRITPAGKAIGTIGDLVTNLVVSPDGRMVIALNSGFQPHGLNLFDIKTHQQTQQIELPSTWLGMAWSSDGQRLYVSGGNRSGYYNRADPVAPIYEFSYANGRLNEKPAAKFVETIDPKLVWWSGVAYLPSRHWLYAANRGTGTGPSNVVVFDAKTYQIVTRIPIEVSPYQLVMAPDERHLFVSNWSSNSVSVIDTSTNQVIRTLQVGKNPNDMKLSADGRLFVACSNDNTVYVIDTHTLEVIEQLSTTLTPHAPEGSTPDALAVDNEHKLLYIANADNNSIAVADIANRVHTAVVGFIPTGWYPSALVLTEHASSLYIGNAKGEEGHADLKGPHSPLASHETPFPGAGGVFSMGEESVHTLQKSNLEVLSLTDLKTKLPLWTHQVIANTPYKDSLLSEARPPAEPSIIPQQVGRSTPITHVIYIIKENRTYDQVFGDLSQANGDPRLTIFGEKVTPNQHALVKQYAILDNLYCDGEVSMDGHSWSNAAYATDYNEKSWPSMYGGHSTASYNVQAMTPASGSLWDDARRKGLTYRSYGENGARASQGAEAAPGTEGLVGHMAVGYPTGLAVRDTEKVKFFLQDLGQYEKDYDSPDPLKKLPNYTLVWMGDDHTAGTTPGAYSPKAMVADNDYAIGQLVDAVSHSRYWPNTAIFIIEDDAQDGPDHVDARRTVGLVIGPYVKRGIVDSTLYSTSSMLRSMELLLGLPPMSQYDAAAMPMYASFGTTPVATPFSAIQPQIDVNAKNTSQSYGAHESSKMNFSQPDLAPMHALNEIIWKSVKGPDSVMPAPVHRFRPLIDSNESAKGDADD
jgi:YVTN family beta-propeller protein